MTVNKELMYRALQSGVFLGKIPKDLRGPSKVGSGGYKKRDGG